MCYTVTKQLVFWGKYYGFVQYVAYFSKAEVFAKLVPSFISVFQTYSFNTEHNQR